MTRALMTHTPMTRTPMTSTSMASVAVNPPIAPTAAVLATPPVMEPGGGEDQTLSLQPEDYGLMTDLYQLTMGACYTGEGLDQRSASFELFARRLPEDFGYAIAMGLAQALDYLEKLRFTAAQIAALQATGIFAQAPDRFWAALQNFQFSGDVWAVPEGTAVFANQPLLRIDAPLWQAQLVETYLLNTINYQTLVATRAARIRDVAGEEANLMEFGTRRAFSPQAAVWAARAALAAGFDATSNVLAALKLGRRPAGTMAHALVMALDATEGSEAQAFQAFHRYFPGAPLLIDTYDPIRAALTLADRQTTEGLELAGVRLDSGDLVSLSQQIRTILPNVPITASGDLDEYRIAALRAQGATIDHYGLGTKLVTGTPFNGVYKLVEIDGKAVMKEAEGKITYPGRKQIFRTHDRAQPDRLGLATETAQPGETGLLQLVMRAGQRQTAAESLQTIADRTRQSVRNLTPEQRQISPCAPQSPSTNSQISAKLERLIQTTRRQPQP
jgi:nicotinate phosphoribosyltransferase